MDRMIFINFPVADLPRAKAFYTSLGFRNEPKFTDETAACMVWSDAIHVMLLTHDKWRSFTDKPLPASGTCGVMLALSCPDRGAVDTMVDTAGAEGGTADANPMMDLGFMYSRSFADPDGHLWEPMWMDPAMAAVDAQAVEA